MPHARAVSSLPRHLAVAYGLLIVYACLHPLTGWRPTGLPLLDFLAAPWPKYYRGADIVLNVLGFLPFGFVLAPSLPLRLGRGAGVAVATLLATLLSFGMEVTQNFLPTRVPSNVDLACNTAGALLGALAGARWGHPLFDQSGWLHRWRSARIIPGHMGDLGLILLGLWLLAQFTPDRVLFGSGDLRQLLGLPTPLHFEPDRYILLETVQVAITIVGVGLFARCMMRSASPWPVALLLALGIGAKSIATASFYIPGEALLWLTPGTRQGLLLGLLALTATLLLASVLQHALAGVALLAATSLTNLLPENPYFEVGHRMLGQGNFLNFHGLTELSANLWPFLALAYLSAVGLWRGEHLTQR
ncbi:VanZ like family protein [Aromatoleum tolulyticum]|uniref:VanZ like family protein n=1 Tax=Aromatoleum tolulyticum TaxID=34027 RepID=A0A1N7BDI8_9RHOO|nr:VanZ family protein [Aromatoleum tolulyticum]SIR49407.1 VanZ like family protein [Aromatoleum tolulyticum]